MRFWTFMDYLTADGDNVILAWLNGLPKKAKAKINQRILFTERMEMLDRPQVGFLQGACEGLMELRVHGADNIQYRPLCCYGLGKRDVTILFGAIEKGSKLVPPSACASAQNAKTEHTGKGRTCEHNFG